MAPRPPKFKAGDIVRHKEGVPYMFVVEVKGAYYDLMVLKRSGLPARHIAKVNLIDSVCMLAT